MAYRHILDAVREKVPAKTYDTRSVKSSLPSEVRGHFPLFGTEEADADYVSSGGRSLLMVQDGVVYRVKGADPKGVITKAVAGSKKNITRDVDKSVPQAPDPKDAEKSLHYEKGFNFHPYHGGKPWNFLTGSNVRNASRAFEALAEAYTSEGFSFPCKFAGSIEYPTVLWDDRPLHSTIYRLPNEESDLRENELETKFKKHLQHASVEQLRELEADVHKLYEAFQRWHGFDCRVLMDAGLVPSPASFIGQNYVIGTVGPGQVGISRVDHTSTMLSPSLDDVNRAARTFSPILYNIASWITQGIEMARKGVTYDTKRYSNYFDRAMKLHEGFKSAEYPKAAGYISRAFERSERYLQRPEPEPADEALLNSVFKRITEIKIDEEFEAERTKLLEAATNEMLKRMGITMDEFVALIAANGGRLPPA